MKTEEKVAGGLGVIVVLAAIFWARVGRAATSSRASDSAPGPRSPDYAPNPTPKTPEVERWARGVLLEAFRNVMGRDPSIAEIQYVQAIAKLESSYGRGWKGGMAAANNWGAVQCPASAQSGPDCIAYEDGHADGTRYKITFRRYDTPVKGAEDVVRHVFSKRPITAAVLASDDGTIFRASWAMRRERYFEGFCPKATKQYGKATARAAFKDPDRDDGTRACAREAITTHATLVRDHIRNAAGANGDSRVLPLGTYEDAETWWASRSGAPASPARASSPATPAASPAPAKSASASASSSPPATAPAPPPAAPAVRPVSTPLLGSKVGGWMLAAVRDGNESLTPFVPVPWEDLLVEVSADALRTDVTGHGLLRLPVSWADTLEICRLRGLVPLVAELADAIWVAAPKKLRVRPLGKWDTPEEQKDSSRRMLTLEYVVAHNKLVDEQISALGLAETDLRADVGKDWILSRRLGKNPRWADTYGWRGEGAVNKCAGVPCAQPRGQDDRTPAHDYEHYDQTQVFRAVRRFATRRGSSERVDLIERYAAMGMPAAILDTLRST